MVVLYLVVNVLELRKRTYISCRSWSNARGIILRAGLKRQASLMSEYWDYILLSLHLLERTSDPKSTIARARREMMLSVVT